MRISIAWLNRYLTGADRSATEVSAALEQAGFPIEDWVDLPNGDVVLDVEITSNRGDCLSHVGLAREVAAASGGQLQLPEIPFDPATGLGSKTRAESIISVDNLAPEVCPRFTARVIRGVRVGPSPSWMVEALEAIGQRSINNIVDVSNYVLFELGQPTHTFDLNKLAGQKIVVRFAQDKEKLVALDGREHALAARDLVVADAERAVSLAGVIGGEETAVTEKTTDVLLETATWDPVTIRTSARRLRITTDAGHRFERIVDPRQIDFAAARCAALILEVAGGELLEGASDAGRPLNEKTSISFRPSRCERMLGVNIPVPAIVEHLRALEVETDSSANGDAIQCQMPWHRPDLLREIDLIEEVARINGLDQIPINETMNVEVQSMQLDERAMRELASVLTGLGLYETVTFSFVKLSDAALFMPTGLTVMKVDEERRSGEPALRPSVIPSLLRCRNVNQDAGANILGGVRLFETASVFAQTEDGMTVENRNLALLIDAPDAQQSWCDLRGVIEACAHAMGSSIAKVTVEPAPPVFKACRPDAHARVFVNGKPAGYMALMTGETLASFDLKTPVAAAEINLSALTEMYPPASSAEPLPAFPAIERDLSVLVEENVRWGDIENAVREITPPRLERVDFAGVYRGKQVGACRKSVTIRLRFRDPERTLRHEEVDPEIERVVSILRDKFAATLRT
jgi:phenylalanyl-tRNA synthetase beta chain